ncbi:MAG: hypothetical protein K2Y21_10170 [Phycisphaerales bacterium]|nr:hypothetical protein [Phycisphaerales bacterium]
MRTARSIDRVMIATSLLGAATLWLTGCNIIGPAYYFIHGPEKVPAAFELDRKRTTIVFVDDQNSMLKRRNLRQEIGAAATETIQREKLVDDMLDSRAAIIASTRDRDGEPMSVVDIGRATKADVVIHVIIDGFTLSQDGVSYAPVAAVRVKIIDAKNDTRLFPPAQLDKGLPVNVTMFEKPSSPPTTSAAVVQAENELAREVGQTVAELFFEHEVRRPNRRSQ